MDVADMGIAERRPVFPEALAVVAHGQDRRPVVEAELPELADELPDLAVHEFDLAPVSVAGGLDRDDELSPENQCDGARALRAGDIDLGAILQEGHAVIPSED